MNLAPMQARPPEGGSRCLNTELPSINQVSDAGITSRALPLVLPWIAVALSAGVISVLTTDKLLLARV